MIGGVEATSSASWNCQQTPHVLAMAALITKSMFQRSGMRMGEGEKAGRLIRLTRRVDGGKQED